MDLLFDHSLGLGGGVLLAVCLLVALGFEFVNGFHDTANAVATVIYTNTLKPHVAVLLSGVCNFTGVFVGGVSVAMGIVKLLPVELLVEAGRGASMAMVLALLVAAILWNVGTWYLGLPASSSHTLIGAILGVGLASSAMHHQLGKGVNWTKATEVGLSLLLSPVAGFSCAALLLLVLRRYARNRALVDRPPPKGAPPPLGTRALLVGTCSGVSFAHGSNDGQKGVGLVMLILVGLVPTGFALDLRGDPAKVGRAAAAATALAATVEEHSDRAAAETAAKAKAELARVHDLLAGKASAAEVPEADRFPARVAILKADGALNALVKAGGLALTDAEKQRFDADRAALRKPTEYAPVWVQIAIALALGIGTTVGWKRIVVTVGEKIGKAHLTYAQGASAELVAAAMIALATFRGLPVSTTHVLSSGIAGTMVAQGSGVQGGTVQKIGLAWVLTLPASMLLSAVLYAVFHALLA